MRAQDTFSLVWFTDPSIKPTREEGSGQMTYPSAYITERCIPLVWHQTLPFDN